MKHFQKQTLVWGIHCCLAVRNKSHWKAFFVNWFLTVAQWEGGSHEGCVMGPWELFWKEKMNLGSGTGRSKWSLPKLRGRIQCGQLRALEKGPLRSPRLGSSSLSSLPEFSS